MRTFTAQIPQGILPILFILIAARRHSNVHLHVYSYTRHDIIWTLCTVNSVLIQYEKITVTHTFIELLRRCLQMHVLLLMRMVEYVHEIAACIMYTSCKTGICTVARIAGCLLLLCQNQSKRERESETENRDLGMRRGVRARSAPITQKRRTHKAEHPFARVVRRASRVLCAVETVETKPPPLPPRRRQQRRPRKGLFLRAIFRSANVQSHSTIQYKNIHLLYILFT